MTSPAASPRFLVFGAGAIGTYLGASLALQGYPVVFLERPEIAPLIQARGMTLIRQGEAACLKVPRIAISLEEALALGPFDAAILAVKSFDTAALAQSLLPYRDQIPPILCLQNGVENEPLLASLLGEDKVIPGTVTTAIGKKTSGEIVVERLRGIGVSAQHAISPVLVSALNAAGLKATAYANPQAMKWSKLLTNLQANPSSAILDLSPLEIFSHPGLYRLEMGMLREALAVMKAGSIPVIDLPDTPVRILAFLVQLPPALSQPLLRRALGKGRGGKMPSFHIDLHSGRGNIEVDYLNGAIVRFGKKLGISTPINQILNETLLALSKKDLPLETFSRQPQKLLDLIPSHSLPH